jgi:putative Mg2+ transporter-C (MgtC) family protein
MPLTLSWHEIAIRLALSLLAGGLIGLDRGERGRPAGLRTTLLVCLAAAVTMIQANLLLATTGKATDSFVTIDLMRLPLGILTGMGFIGGGAILRRDNLVLGVTTAATLWLATVIGLCFGGGQIGLGVAASILAMLVLSGMRSFDHRIKQEQHGILNLTTDRYQPTEEDIRTAVHKAGYEIGIASVAIDSQTGKRELEFKLQWREEAQKSHIPAFLEALAEDERIAALHWKVS